MYAIRAPQWPQTDLERLLTPVSAASPCGESLRYEGAYDRIAEARKEDDPVLARGVWKMPLKRADWQKVEALCLDALANRTKDLQIAAWLLESWTRLYGFAGLRTGFEVLVGLCERFWEGIWPRPEDGDQEYRAAPFVSLNEKLPVTLKLLPVTAPASDDVKAYCWADWELLTRTQTSGPPAKADPEAPTQASFQQSALLTPTAFYRNLLDDVDGSIEGCAELERILRERCDDEAPSLRQLWTTMDAIRGLLATFLNQRAGEDRGEAAGEEAPRREEAAPRMEELQPDAAGGSIRSRAEAYRRLAEAADYLARTEPHSPTPYLVRRAIAWGGMRLEELLQELVHTPADLAEVYKLLQIGKHEK